MYKAFENAGKLESLPIAFNPTLILTEELPEPTG
jgi:hypothetical protein